MAPATDTPNGGTPATMVTAKQAPASNDPKVNFSTTVEEAPATAAAADGEGQAEEEKSNKKLYKSSRLKGYITLILAGVINYSAARNSQKVLGDGSNSKAIAASDGQRAYAEAVALTSCLICAFIFLAHLDRWSPLRGLWQKAFGDGAKVELVLILFLVIWWTIATGIQTSVRGIAGDGKGQYNLYYSTWCCCWTSFWTLERWLVAYGWSSFRAFISSWPFRAPGWIAIFVFSFACLMCYLDLYSHHETATKVSPLLEQHYAEIGNSQWDWLMFVGTATVIPALVFIIVELFRGTATEGGEDAMGSESHHSNEPLQKRFSLSASAHHHHQRSQLAMSARRQESPNLRASRQFLPQRQNPLPDKGNSTGGKGPVENILEGFCLALLVLAWIPTVIVATSPGGSASIVGNSYFFTWINTVFVMETFIWFVHDFRAGVHSALQVKEREYAKVQQEVLQKSRALEAKRMAAGSWQNDAVDDIELDEVLPTATMKAVLAPPATPPPETNPDSDLSDRPSPPQPQEVDEMPAQRRRRPRSPNITESIDATDQQTNIMRMRGSALDDDLGGPPPGEEDHSLQGSTLFFDTSAALSPSSREMKDEEAFR